jgi:preprotein translocase subunit SecD
MTGSRHRMKFKKAGLSGLFCFSVLAIALLTFGAEAEPLKIEVSKAEAFFDQRIREPAITIRMSETSKKPFNDFTAKNVGRKMEIRVDGKVVSAPVIRDPFLGSTFQISGRFSEQEARDIAARISAGISGLELEIVD